MGRSSLCVNVVFFVFASAAAAQSLGSAGTVEGTVTDPSGATVPGATATLLNRITSYQTTATTGSSGTFRFTNVPPNPYHLTVKAPGFAPLEKDVSVRSAVPLTLKLRLALAGEKEVVNVEAYGAGMLENVPYAHSDVDREEYSKLPITSPASGLSDAITLASPGVVADSNGFFHPLGDHAQTSFSIDGQPISDQQSKEFSTQIPLNAIQSMELITGAPPAEFGDKTSLVVNAVTRSGLGLTKPTGSFKAQYGSFGTYGEQATLGLGGPKFGNFLVANSLRSGRFLDTPEFELLHAKGNNEQIFDHVDYQPNSKNILHMDLLLARNWFQIPNTWDQQFASQDQRQLVRTFNIAPGYEHTFGTTTLLAVHPFLRQDYVDYYPSRDLFADTPATVAQSRRLRSGGIKSDVAYAHGVHNLKAGVQFSNWGLSEDFRFGITDPAFNPVCLAPDGSPVTAPTPIDPGACTAAGYVANPDVQTGLIPFDLTRGGTLLAFRGLHDINEISFFVQDQITYHGLSISPGLRVDHYAGLATDTQAQPRIGFSYLIRPTGTVVRGSYSRTMETPYNENLLLSSTTGLGGLGVGAFGAFGEQPLRPGIRDQFNAGLQQALGKYLVVDGDYFWKFTDNAYDFDTLFNTPIVFPISWRKSKIDGVSGRISTPNLHGLMAYTVMGHTRARFFGPETGGLIFNSPVNTGVFRIDHDEAFEQTTSARYQFGKTGPWLAFTWRYDSGLVAGAVGSLDDALALDGDQQAAIGFFCGNHKATLFNPITSCDSPNYGATRLRIPAPGTEDDDHNPPRIAPRHLFDISVGTDNLVKLENARLTARFTVTNLTNKVALYNFLSTFSGTHFVTPRSYQAELGIAF
jgi:hypothetical protein